MEQSVPQVDDIWEDVGLSTPDMVVVRRVCEYENLDCDGPIKEHVHVSSLSGRNPRTVLQRHFNGRRFTLFSREGQVAG